MVVDVVDVVFVDVVVVVVVVRRRAVAVVAIVVIVVIVVRRAIAVAIVIRRTVAVAIFVDVVACCAVTVVVVYPNRSSEGGDACEDSFGTASWAIKCTRSGRRGKNMIFIVTRITFLCGCTRGTPNLAT